MGRSLVLFLLLCYAFVSSAQSFQFAHVTDIHVGGSTSMEDLRSTIADINANPDLAFVIISGDITEFGSDEELWLAKQLLDSIHIPWYLVPGNHDTNWSESGGNSFRRVFGQETFAFIHEGFLFMGTNSGPNMRMSPGQIPRENLVWMDSIFTVYPDAEMPLIYINHYPQDSSLNNWFEAIDRLKTRNVQLMLCGHGHQNKVYGFEGIPSVMGRSNLRTKDTVGGYNIVEISDGKATYRERNPGVITQAPWASIPLINHRFGEESIDYPRPSYAVNAKYPDLKALWTFQDDSDVGAGMASYKQLLITANTAGELYALDTRTGKRKWVLQTGGKIYSTPAVWKNYVVVGSADNFIYGVDARTGKLLWKYEAEKAVLGSPLVHNGHAYIGASDGRFRKLDVRSGKLMWAFDQVKGYVSAKPLLYEGTIYFGCWGNGFYALDPSSGKLLWEWSNGSSSRMLSPAACYPVGADGKVFIVAPDRFMTALNAKTGAVIWREKKEGIRVRESMGLSEDGQLVYVKTMDGEVLGISTAAPEMDIVWQSALRLPYELTPSAIMADNGLVFIPSHSGLLSVVSAAGGEVAWQYKLSNGMVNPLLCLSKNRIVGSTMDGRIVCLQYNSP